MSDQKRKEVVISLKSDDDKFELEKAKREIASLREEYEKTLTSVNKSLEEMTNKANEFETKLGQAKSTISDLEGQLADAKAGRGITALNDEIDQLKSKLSELATRSTAEFKAFLESVNLNDTWGTNDWRFKDILKDLEDGFITAGQAIMRVKTEYQELMESSFNNGGAFDSQSVQAFSATLEQVAGTLNEVVNKINEIERSGIGSGGGGGGGGGFASSVNVIEQIRAALEGMSEEAQDAIAPIKSLIESITAYGALDSDRLYAISHAFGGIADIGNGNFGKGSIANLTSLIKTISEYSANGPIRLSIDLQGFENLSVRKTSLANLAEYLPQLQKVNASKLQELSKVNLTNFNDIKVGKGAIGGLQEYIVQLETLANTLNSLTGGISTASPQAVSGDTAISDNASSALAEEEQRLKELNSKYEEHIAEVKEAVEAERAKTVQSQELSGALDNEAEKMTEAGNAASDGAAKMNDVVDGLHNVGEAAANINGERIGEIRSLLKSEGADDSFANKVANDFKNLSGHIEKVTTDYKVFGDTGKTVSTVTATYVDNVGRKFEETRKYIREVVDEEEQWHTEMSSKAVVNYGNESSAAFKKIKAAVDEYYFTLKLTKDSGLEWNGTAWTSTVDGAQRTVVIMNEVEAAFRSLTSEESLSNLSEKERAALIEYLTKKENEYIIKLESRAVKERGVAASSAESGNAARTAYESANTALTRGEGALRKWSAAANSMRGSSRAAFAEVQSKVAALAAEIAAFGEGTGNIDRLREATEALKRALQSSGDIIGANGDKVLSLSDRIGGLYKKFGTLFSATRIIMAVVNELKKMIQTATDVDYAMNQMQIVTKQTDSYMKEFGETAASVAKEISASMTDVIESATVFARLGYDMNDSALLSKYTTMLQNVGDIDVSSAQEAVTAIVKAFDVSVDDIESIMDKLVTTGNNFPISVSQIAEGMNNASSVLAATGNTFEQSVALLTAANTTIQDASKAATGIRTLAARITKTKTELDGLGEAMTDSDYNDMVKALTSANVQLTKANGEFRSTYEIMADIAAKWDSLSSIQQNALAQTLAGTRQQSVFYSIINQFQEASGAMDAMANSTGALDAAYSTYLDSITAHTDKFNATFQELSANLINSEIAKIVIDAGTGLLSLTNSLAETHTLLISIASAIAFIKAFSIANKISKISTSLISQKIVTDTLKTSIAGLSEAEKLLVKRNIETAASHGLISKKEKEQLIEQLGLTVSTTGLTGAVGGLKIGLKGLAAGFKSVIASIPVWGWIALGISVVLDVVVGLTSSLGNATDKMKELDDEMSEITSDAQNATKSFTDMKSSFDDVVPRFVELAKGVNDFGENVSLTSEEYEEFWELNNKIAEMFPEIDAGLDSNGNHILSLSYSVNSLTESLNALLEAERQMANETASEKIGDALSNIKKATNEYNKQKAEAYRGIANLAGIDVGGLSLDSDLWKQYEQLSITAEKQINDINEKIAKRWEKINPLMGSWLQTTDEFNVASEEVQKTLIKVFGNIDYAAIGETNEKNLKSFVTNNIIKPLADATPEIQHTVAGMFDIKSLFDSGQINVGEFNIVNDLLQGLKDAGLSESFTGALESALGLDSFNKKVEELKDGIKGVFTVTGKDARDFIDGLDGEQLDIAYNIYAKNGSMTWTELKDEIDKLRYANADWVEPLDFSNIASGLEGVAGSVDKITSAMAELKKGTQLTGKEMLDLIDKYPELLNQADIFAKGSVEAQQNALNAILDMQEQEYDKEIDVKIAELEATQQVIEDQLSLEEKKANVLLEIETDVANGKIDTEQELVDKISEYNDLQGQNFVKMEDGILTVNEAALKDKLKQESDAGKSATENIWKPYSEVIAESHAEGFGKALEAGVSFFKKLYNDIKTFASSVGNAIANWWKDLWDGGEYKGGSYYFSEFLSGLGDNSIDVGPATISWKGGDPTINGQNLDDWISEQRKASDLRIEQLKEIQVDTQVAIDNLRDLKGLSLGEIYKSTSSSSSSSAKSDANSWFAKEYSLHNHYVEMDMESMEDYLEWLNDAYQRAYEEGVIVLDDYYKYQEEVYSGLKDLFKDYLNDTEHHISMLQAAGESNYTIVALYKQMISAIEAEISQAYARGLDATDDYVQELQDKLVSYTDSIRDLFKDTLNDIEHHISMLQAAGASNDAIVAIYKQMISDVERELASAYAQGLSDTDDYIQELQDKIVSYTDSIRDLFKDTLNDIEHEISMREAFKGESKKIVQLYKGMISSVEKEIAAARASGLSDTDDYIQELQDKWVSYRDAIVEIEENLKSEAEDAVKELVDYRLDMLKDDLDNEKDIINKKLDYLEEFYQKQKDMLSDALDEETYLEEQNEKRKAVTDIKAELEQIQYDNSAWAQKRRLELENELYEKQKDLDDFEKDHAVETAQDTLDEIYDAQKSAYDDQIDLLDEKLGDAKGLYEQALEDIRNASVTMYEEMLAWNAKYGDGIDETITTAWENAYEALRNYKDYFDENYDGFNISNATGYTPKTESWDSASISGSTTGTVKTVTQSGSATVASSGNSVSGGNSGVSSGGGAKSSSGATVDDATKRKVAAAIWNGNYGWGSDPDRRNRLNEVFGANNGIQDLVNKGIGKNDPAPDWAYSYLNMRKKLRGYSSGTNYATRGWHGIDENGAEAVFESANGNKYRLFTGGEMVLNADASNFLYKFATSGAIMANKMSNKMYADGLGLISPNIVSNEIKLGDIIVNGNADLATVSEIRRAQRESVSTMLKELNRLNR